MQNLAIGLREMAPDDYPRVCELRNLTMVEPVTVELLVSRDENWPPEGIRERLIAHDGESVLAAGQVTHWAGMAEGRFYLNIDVDIPARRKGIGSRLLDELEGRAREHGGTRVIGAARDDREEGVGFFRSKGYSFHQHLIDSRLDLGSFDSAAFDALGARVEGQGIQFVRYSELPDTQQNRRRLHELHNACDADTPGIEEWGLSPFEDFEAEFFMSPRHCPEGIVLAMRGDDWIGVSMVGPASSEEFGTHFTGVRPGWRGRRIGLAAKAKAIGYAKARGARGVRAQNDVRNRPMLDINTALGFLPQFGWVYWGRDL